MESIGMSWDESFCGSVVQLLLQACACTAGLTSLVFLFQCAFAILPELVFIHEPPPQRVAAALDGHAITRVGALSSASAAAPGVATAIMGRAEPSALLYRDISSANLFERVATARAARNELVLLTSDLKQLAMTLNLVAQLNELGIGHHLLLGRDEATCDALHRRGRVACVWSSYLMHNQTRSREGVEPSLPYPRKYVKPVELMWLQRHHYLGRAIAAGLNVLLLDSDVLLARDPYQYLKSPPFSGFQAIALSDSTGSAKPLHLNGGVWYIQNASADGPLRALFSRFDEHVRRLLNFGGSGSTFDQQIINEQLVGLLPHGPLAALLRRQGPHDGAETLIDVTPGLIWRWSCCHATPAEIPRPGGSYGATFGVRWLELPPLGHTGAPTTQRPAERIAKAPPWLFSAESDLAPPPWWLLTRGVRVDSRGWGAMPPPWVVAHFVCTAWPGSDGREQAMRVWGHWRAKAIGRDLPEEYHAWREARVRMVGLARPVSQQSEHSLDEAAAWVRLVVALALATGRTPVLPAMHCAEKQLLNRCVWQVAGSNFVDGRLASRQAHVGAPHGPTCVLRWPSECSKAMVLPGEAHEAADGSVRRLSPKNASELIALLRAEPPAPERAHEAWRRPGGSSSHTSSRSPRGPVATGVSGSRQAYHSKATNTKLLLLDVGARPRLQGAVDVEAWKAALVDAFLPKQGHRPWYESVHGFAKCPIASAVPPRCQAVC